MEWNSNSVDMHILLSLLDVLMDQINKKVFFKVVNGEGLIVSPVSFCNAVFLCLA